MKVDIFRRDSGEVVEAGKEVGELKTWEFYWNMQCNDQEWGWREHEEEE